MSLIADALRTAQREKERREARQGSAEMPAVLIAMRGGDAAVRWYRPLVIGLSGVAVIAAAALLVRRGADELVPPAPPPLASVMLSQAIAGDSASVRGRPTPGASTQPARAATPSNAPVADAGAERLRSGERPAAPAPVAAAISATVAPDSALVVQQADESRDAGLRIAVDAPSAGARRLFARAVEAHRAGDLSAARALYERVLSVEPEHADALNNLGVLLSAQRDLDRAVVTLRRASRAASGNASVWSNLGAALRERGSGEEAVAAFRRALAIDPAHQGARIGLAQQFLAIDAFDEAIGLLRQVLAAHPGAAEAHYTLGQVLERRGDREAAVRSYDAFIRTAPAHLSSHVERVRAHVESLSSRTP